MEDFGWKVPWATKWIRIDINLNELAKNELVDAETIPKLETYEVKRRAKL
jgi:hypothetical protein